MPAEFDVYGVYIPRLLVLMLFSFALMMPLRSLLSRAGAYKLIWHRSLFDLCLYVLLLGAASSVSRW